jgi:hypothetical protein
MAYVGEILNECDSDLFRKRDWFVIVVSGLTPCGHALLNLGGPDGYYVHVDGVYKHPKKMNRSQFERYLRENNKRVLRRDPVYVPNPTLAFFKAERLLSEKWAWGGLVHNCASFVEEIIRAGGGRVSVPANCPTTLLWKHSEQMPENFP